VDNRFTSWWTGCGKPVDEERISRWKSLCICATHPSKEPLQIIFNFEEDIEEMKIAKGIEDNEAA
jgi:hypothetical protein